MFHLVEFSARPEVSSAWGAAWRGVSRAQGGGEGEGGGREMKDSPCFPHSAGYSFARSHSLLYTLYGTLASERERQKTVGHCPLPKASARGRLGATIRNETCTIIFPQKRCHSHVGRELAGAPRRRRRGLVVGLACPCPRRAVCVPLITWGQAYIHFLKITGCC